uniref:Uncharacterized protein n=1 Tax=Fundulus heteroclitus TaxID=8078 RepID=A0A3Q2UK65_FUNHE
MAQSRKKQTVFQVYENKRKASEKRNKTRVYLGDSFPQWRALKALTGIPTDASFAGTLDTGGPRGSSVPLHGVGYTWSLRS